MPRFLADENVFTATTQLMRDLGLQVERVQELGMIGSDARLFIVKRKS